jgi:AraC-like DNA-binding protein
VLVLAKLLAGFSIFCAVILAATHFRTDNYPEQNQARYIGLFLVAVLGAIQYFHFIYLESGTLYIHTTLYQVLLFSVAPGFYLFSKPLLKGEESFQARTLLHALPVIAAPFLPAKFALPSAFAVGAVYLLWLAHSLYSLRAQRSRFHMEIAVLGITLLIALAVLIMGLSLPQINEKLFFCLYASAIGCAFILVNLAINLTPRLPVKLAEAAAETYVKTTLNNVNCDEALHQLTYLMTDRRIYENPELDMGALARQLGLTSHQLSELINTRMGIGFSRYLREQRIEAARTMLLAEPSASVLSIGLSVGFTSQSNFYDAFREVTGMTPGKYRKITHSPAPK